MDLSVKRVGHEKTAPVSASSTKCMLLFVQRNSRKRGPWNYSLTCRPVLTQLLVPKTTRENGKKSSALNTPTASANSGPSPSLRQCYRRRSCTSKTAKIHRFVRFLCTVSSLHCSVECYWQCSDGTVR